VKIIPCKNSDFIFYYIWPGDITNLNNRQVTQNIILLDFFYTHCHKTRNLCLQLQRISY